MAQPGVGYNQNGIGSVSRDNAMERTTFQIGDRVYAPWRRERLFPARVTFISNGTAYFSYDDGETDRMSSRRLQPSNKVFLIESVSRKPTERHWSEGRLLGEFLRMIGGRPLYSFIRTKLELGHFLKLARLSSGSHIHLSMHGLKNKLVLQLEEVDIEELITLAGDLSGKIVFSSSCLTGNEAFGKAFIRGTAAEAFISPRREIRWADAALVSQLFYKKLLCDGVSPYVAYRFVRRWYPRHADLRFFKK
jgi:hypothetical protein